MNHDDHQWCRKSNDATNDADRGDRDKNNPIAKLSSFFYFFQKKKRKERLTFRQHEPRHEASAYVPTLNTRST